MALVNCINFSSSEISNGGCGISIAVISYYEHLFIKFRKYTRPFLRGRVKKKETKLKFTCLSRAQM